MAPEVPQGPLENLKEICCFWPSSRIFSTFSTLLKLPNLLFKVSNGHIWLDKVRRSPKIVEKIEKYLEIGQKLQFSLKFSRGPWGTPGAIQTPKNGFILQ